jgi:hypothetical protein
MNRQISRAAYLLLALLAVCGWHGPVRAGTDIDFGTKIRAADDSELFMAIASRYFGRDPADVRDWRSRYRDPDDAAVALFLSARSGKNQDAVSRLRSGGRSWWEVGRKLEVQPADWFVPCPYRPGPPYGNAYGYWRKYESNHKHRFELKDREARDLVAVRMLHDYYGMSPAEAMKWRAGQQDVQSLMAREYRKRHHHEHEDRLDDDRHHGGRGDGPGKHGRGKSRGR